MNRNDGGAAYPSGNMVYRTLPHGAEVIQGGEPGISIRDYFAGQALAGILAADGEYAFNRNEPIRTALQAYALADAMLAERAKGTSNAT